MSADPHRHPLVEKLHARRDHHRTRRGIVRVLYALTGVTLLVAGIAMLVLPGPAFVVIPLGLFLLALEFTWAERALVHSLHQAEKAREKAANATRTQRVLSVIATVLAVGAFAAWALLGDVPLLPV